MKQSRRLATSFQSKGAFWLPAAQPMVIAGVVKFDPEEGICLETQGSLAQEHLSGTGSCPVIMGTLVDGTTVTLMDAFVKQITIGMSDLWPQSGAALTKCG